MKRLVAALVFMLAVAGTGCHTSAQSAGVAQPVAKQPVKHTMLLTAKKIDNTNLDGVTRITVVVQGLPHTAQRIDDVVLHTGNEQLHATDIDGVDFKRYFQWEDEGLIEVDIDFPRRKNLKASDTMVFMTVYGDYETPLGKAVNNIK